MSFTNQDRYIINDVTFSDPAYAPFTYESEWFPADSSTYFDYQVTVDDLALVGMEFSNTKGGSIIDTVSDRAITNTLCTVTAKSQGSWVRMFIREIGLTSSNLQSIGPFDISSTGFYYKQQTTGLTTRVHDLSAWGNLGAVSVTTPWVQTKGNNVLVCQVDNRNANPFGMICEWSNDGVNITAIDNFPGNAAFLNESLPVRGRYVRAKYEDASLPNRWDGNFFFSEDTLIETVELTTDASEDLQITNPSPGVELITVGNKHGGTDATQSLFIDQSAPRVGDAALTNSVFLGNRAGSGQTDVRARYSENVCVGTQCHTEGTESIAIGYRASANSGASNSVAIGTNSVSSSAGISIGRQATPANGTSIRTVCLGASSKADSYGVSIGYNAGSFGTHRDYAICLGTGCVQPGANGRLAFGNTMEGVQTTASAGAQTLPAKPAGFLRLEWNGTLYKLPVYND